MKGRKPQKNAIRRGRTPADVMELRAEPAGALAKPDEVIANPDLDALWDTVVASGAGFAPADVPILTQLVYTVNDTGRTSPYFTQMEKATAQILRLSDHLGATPLARARIGIAETATQSMQVDIAAKIRALMDEREGRA